MQILHWLHIYKLQSIVLFNSPQKLRASLKFKAGHLWEYVFNSSCVLNFSSFVYKPVGSTKVMKRVEIPILTARCFKQTEKNCICNPKKKYSIFLVPFCAKVLIFLFTIVFQPHFLEQDEKSLRTVRTSKRLLLDVKKSWKRLIRRPPIWLYHLDSILQFQLQFVCLLYYFMINFINKSEK